MVRTIGLLRKTTKRVCEKLQSWHIVRGDKVQITVGKDKGKIGNIVKVLRDTNRVIVSGANLAKKHFKRVSESDAGGIHTIEAPLHVSNVSLLDPSDNKPTRIRVGYMVDDATGEQQKVRVSKKSGLVIPRPSLAEEARAERAKHQEGQLDTKAEDAIKKTYIPSCVPLFVQRESFLKSKPRR